jgi:ribosomal-protein-alanine N-acetyltransferase
MTQDDMEQVLDIEFRCFEFHWSNQDFMECLDQPNCAGLVFEHRGRVIGFAVFEIQNDQLHILNLAVHPACHRHGVAKQIVATLFGKLPRWKCSRITLQLRETNLVAQLFFRKMAFRAVGILKGFYDDTTEDAYLMQYQYQVLTHRDSDSISIIA